jgi:signal transduction histidine kinase
LPATVLEPRFNPASNRWQEIPIAVCACEQAQREDVRPAVARTDRERHEFSFLKGLIDGMRCGVLSIDPAGNLVLLNEHARRILDLPETPPPGTPLWRALPDYPELVRALTRSFQMSILPNRAEMELARGPRRSIGFTLSMVHGGGGEPCGVAMFFKDLTPIEHKEEQERLKDRLAALGQMAASMAHEIRNPLAAIEVNCKLLGRRLAGDATCEGLLAKIKAEVDRLNRSVDSCLRYVRPVEANLVRSELVPLLEEAIGRIEERHPRPRIEIERRLEAGIPPFLMDRALLRQVFENLILNALEAVGDTGRVTVAAERVEAPGAASVPYQPSETPGDPWGEVQHFAVVRVFDTGPGIGEEDRDRIFHPFFTTKEHGSGVGLAVAKKIVSSHRGMIQVASAPDEGAEIVVRLPMVVRTAEDRIHEKDPHRRR